MAMIRDSDLIERLLTDGRPGAITAASVQGLIATVGDPACRDPTRVVLALGMLAESDADSELLAALARGVDTYLGRLAEAPDDQPLVLALLFLLAHFPAEGARIMAAVDAAPLDEDDRGRLERCLDPARFSPGRTWPSPAAWARAPAGESGSDGPPVDPAQVVELETQALLAYSGAKAVAAIHGEVL